jgi:hypothetical protein
VAFIGYLCEICSICENMAILCLGSVSKVCAVFEVLCSVSDGTILNLAIVQFLVKKKGDMRYMGASPISVKGRHALWGRVSNLNKRETSVMGVRLSFT